MLAKLSAYPVDAGIDVAIVFVVIVGMLAAMYVVDWLRN